MSCFARIGIYDLGKAAYMAHIDGKYEHAPRNYKRFERCWDALYRAWSAAIYAELALVLPVIKT